MIRTRKLVLDIPKHPILRLDAHRIHRVNPVLMSEALHLIA